MKYKKLSEFSQLVRSTDGSAGYDVCSTESVVIYPHQRETVSTGLCFELDPNYYISVCSRSGLARNYGIMVLNAPGIVDSDYRGEVKVILYNSSNTAFQVTPGMRIAQLVLMRCESMDNFTESTLSDSSRGSNGFGHTGLYTSTNSIEPIITH